MTSPNGESSMTEHPTEYAGVPADLADPADGAVPAAVEPVDYVEPGRPEMCDEGPAGVHPIGSPGCALAEDEPDGPAEPVDDVDQADRAAYADAERAWSTGDPAHTALRAELARAAAAGGIMAGDPDQREAPEYFGQGEGRPVPDDPAPDGAEPPLQPELPAGMVALEAGALVDTLTALVECTSTDSEHPVLTTARLEAGNGRLIGVATDQYILAHTRTPARGTAAQTYVPAAGVRRMLAELAGVDRDAEVHLQLEGERIGLQTPQGFLGVYPTKLDRPYPATLTSLLSTDGYDQVGLTGVVGFQPRLLARIHAATDTAGERSARFYFRSPTLPLRVEVGDWLVMLVMPIAPRKTAEYPPAPAIPAGLPDHPLDVPATAPDPTSISWPKALDQVTPARLARHYSAHMLHLQRRVFDEPWPSNLPPWKDQNEVQRRISSARADLYVALVDSYAVASLIRAFAEAAPAAALEAVRDLWDALEYGDSLGEDSWGWLKAADVDPDAIVHDDIAAERDAHAARILTEALAVPAPAVDPFRKAREEREAAEAAAGKTVDHDPGEPFAADVPPAADVDAVIAARDDDGY